MTLKEIPVKSLIFFGTFIQLKDINCPGDGKCSNQGKCDRKRGICTCNEGFHGDNCQSKFDL